MKTKTFEQWKQELRRLFPKKRFAIPDNDRLYIRWEQKKSPETTAAEIKLLHKRQTNEHSYLTAGQLAEHLSKINPNARVIVSGHFGEPYDLDLSNFQYVYYNKGDSPAGLMGPFIIVEQVDVGPEPE